MDESALERRAPGGARHAAVIATALAGALAVACLPRVSFECSDASGCPRFDGGRCDAGNCIYPDDTCLYGERYSLHAEPSVANRCVGGDTATDTDTDSGSGSSTVSGSGASEATTGVPDPMAWWDCAWGRRARVTFGGEEGPPLVDFTVMVALDHTVLGGTFADGGADLRFVDADGETLLDHEIELWDPQGTSIAWVRVPEVRTGEDDGVHLYWENASASAREGMVAWSEQHVGVWHLGANVNDSSATAANGSDDSIGAVAGRVGDAREFAVGMPSRINVGSQAPLDDAFVDGGTVLAWVRIDALPDGEVARVAGKTMSDPGHSGWKLFAVAEPVEMDASSMTLGFHRTFDQNPSEWQGPTDAIATDGEWRLFGATFCDDVEDCRSVCSDDCSGDDCFAGEDPVPRLFLDGNPVLTQVTRPPGGTAVSDAVDQMIIGRGPAGGEGIGGAIDEVRVARTIRCDSWMRAEFLSMTGTLGVAGSAQPSTCGS